ARHALEHLGVDEPPGPLDLHVAPVEEHLVAVLYDGVAPVSARARVGDAIHPLPAGEAPPALDQLGLGERAENRLGRGVEPALDLVGGVRDDGDLGAALAVRPTGHGTSSSCPAPWASCLSPGSFQAPVKRSSHSRTWRRARPSTL